MISAANRFVFSYGFFSLFASIPLKETIDVVENLLFERNPGLCIMKAELKKLFGFATSGTHFLFYGTFCNQVDGVAMDSLLGPVAANLFIGYYKTLS